MTSQWPFPGDAPVVRARKVAWAYRAALQDLKPEAAAELDDRLAKQWGERWITGHVNYDPDDWIDAKEAGAILGVSPGTISSLRIAGRITGVLQDRKRFMFRVRDVWQLADERRHRKPRSGDRVGANGSGAPTDQVSCVDTPQEDAKTP